MYLLDTNICIYAINKKTPHLLDAMKVNLSKGVSVSALTVAELEYGVENSLYADRNRVALMKFLTVFEILPFDESDALHYGKLESLLKKTGRLIGPMDLLLAAQALSKELIFVTNNVDEFKRVDGLRLVDWSKRTG